MVDPLPTPPDTLRPRSADRIGRGATLALLAHAALVIGLSIAVNWRTKSEPVGVDAELWSAVPQMAGPPPAPPPPEPEPVRTPPPPPPPAPAIAPAPPPPPDTREADIALEREKERKAQALKHEQEREAQVQRKLEEEKQRAEQLAKDKAKEKEKEKADKERLAREKEAQDKEREKAQQREKADAAQREKIRQEQLKRMQAGLSGEGSSDGAGSGRDARNAGMSAGYSGRIKARVYPNITFTDNVEGNPSAVVEVRTSPDGTIVGRRLTRSSGIPAWDEAVLRAIDKTEVLPKDVDGRVPPTLEITFRPHDR